MERLYWGSVEFNNQRMFLAASRAGIKFVSNPGRGISQIYSFYRHRSFEFAYQATVILPYRRLLIDYLNGDQIDPKRPDFDLRGCGSRLDHRVWRTVGQIPYGEVRLVGQLARQLGISKKRTVLAICRNPVLMLIPTHRVIVNSRKLGHFRESLSMKSQLLEIETIMRNVNDK